MTLITAVWILGWTTLQQCILHRLVAVTPSAGAHANGGWLYAGGDSDSDGGESAPYADATGGVVAKKRKTTPSSGSVEVASLMCTGSLREQIARLGE
jgi:hypothetical protein